MLGQDLGEVLGDQGEIVKSLLTAALLLAALCLLPINSAHAAESYDNCTNFVTSLPASITTQGTWCLNKNLGTGISSGVAITIAANNVTLDCNNFKIGGLAAGLGTQAIGISATDRNSTTIRNCNVRGFFYGINLDGATSANLIEHNRVISTWVGIGSEGDGDVIRDNQVTDIGGTTVVFGSPIKAVGIYTYNDVEILGNLVSGVVATSGTGGWAIGINAGNNVSGSIIDNNVKNVIGDGVGWSHAIGFFDTTGRVSVDSNNLIGPSTANSTAVICPDGANLVSLAGNIISGWTYANGFCAFDDGNIVH